jgi:hypothetical protein
MRRRRQALQVSTFPFLAVLLCAMGALILLLLVIDRRAKMAALARALHAQQQVAAERAKVRERLRAESEQRRREREEKARLQERHLAEQVVAARGKADSAHVTLDQEERRYRDLQRQFQSLRGRLAQTEREVSAVEAEAEKAGAADAATRRERQRLTEQLAQLEAVLANLKEMREREKRTYSLVPFHGKRGQGRKPIYVECQGEAVVFHPDAKALKGFDLCESGIRQEVEERVARQRAGPDPPEKGEAPYLFLLVRPDGIPVYYLVQNALTGLKVDFGYEFVDADWVLDFSGRGDLPAPWKRVAGPPTKIVPKGDPAPRVGAQQVATRPGRAAFAEDRPVGASGNGGRRPGGFVFPGMDLYLTEKFGASARGGIPGVGPFAEAGGGYPGGGGGGRGVVSWDGLPGTAETALAPIDGQSGATAVSAVVGSQQPRNGLSFSEGTGGPANAPPGGPRPVRGTITPPSDSSPYVPAPQDGTVTLSPISPGVQTLPGQRGPPNVKPGGPDGVPASAGKIAEGTGQPAPSGVGAGVPGGGVQGATGAPGVGIPGGAGGRADSSSDIPPTPLLAPTALPSAARGTKTISAASPLPRTHALNRDWVIPVECQADSALLIPGRVRFSATALAPTSGTVHPLAQAVQQLIARRQATVAPGDPPYRPRILFQVRPEGLRTYYLAYPLLESLRLPMARENVSAKEAPSNRRTIFDP